MCIRDRLYRSRKSKSEQSLSLPEWHSLISYHKKYMKKEQLGAKSGFRSTNSWSMRKSTSAYTTDIALTGLNHNLAMLNCHKAAEYNKLRKSPPSQKKLKLTLLISSIFLKIWCFLWNRCWSNFSPIRACVNFRLMRCWQLSYFLLDSSLWPNTLAKLPKSAGMDSTIQSWIDISPKQWSGEQHCSLPWAVW